MTIDPRFLDIFNALTILAPTVLGGSLAIKLLVDLLKLVGVITEPDTAQYWVRGLNAALYVLLIIGASFGFDTQITDAIKVLEQTLPPVLALLTTLFTIYGSSVLSHKWHDAIERKATKTVNPFK